MEGIDFLGNTFKEGDEIIVIEPFYRNFVKAKVVKVTAQKVRISYIHPQESRQGKKYETTRWHKDVLKI